MLKDGRIHTTLPVADLARAQAFYADKLGLTPAQETPGGLIYECAGGSSFALYPTTMLASGNHTQASWFVSDLTAEVATLQARGVVFEMYDSPGLKTEGGIAKLGSIKLAWFKDSEGNLLGLTEVG
jgi:catechol 2,3-dioxygenase-like lactoylglutathione lyase family enzyme